MPQQQFEYLWSAILSEVPQLPVPLAKRYISDAWLDIQGIREWSFRYKDGILVLPTVVTTGAISVTKNSVNCTLDATGITAWANIGTDLPLISYRQLRFPSRSDRIYNIESYDSGTGAIVLDKLYTGDADVDSTYELYSAYGVVYQATGSPEYNFLRFKSLRSLDYGFTMFDARNLIDRSLLDARDPGRVHRGLPMNYCFSHERTYINGDNRLQVRFYEFWPHCTAGISYEVRYIQKPISFEENEDQYLPDIIPPRLVIFHALMAAYRWAEAHANTHPELARKNWQYLRAQLSSKYPTDTDTYTELLRRATKQDNEILNQELISHQGMNNYRMPLQPMTLVVNPN